MNRLLASAAALSILLACSQGKQTVETEQTPSEPTGSIVGSVTSLRTGQPLQGATVTVAAGGGVRSATTDSNGAYSLGGLVAGAAYLVRASAANHVPGLAVAIIPNAAGDYPSNGIAQVNVALAQANATLAGHVYARDGAPAQGVDLTVDLRGQGFDLVASARTDAQGAYSLTGLPGAPTGISIDVVAQPWDANGDGLADYDALTRTAVTYPAATSLLDFDLRLAAADVLLLTSNVESGRLPVDAQISLTFNRALDTNLTAVTLTDSTAGKAVAIATSFDSTGKIVTVVPDGATPLAAYHTYALRVDAVAATSGATATVLRTFTAETTLPLLPAVAGLTVNPVHADFDTYSFTLSWNAVSGASSYQVWVRDTSRNPTWVLANSYVGSSPAPSTTVTLPATFDYYAADGIQTPLAYGVGVDFAVVAVNAAGDAPAPSTATKVTRADTVAPAVETAIQSGNADNTAGGTAKTITLSVTFSEYMDTSVAPSIALPAGDTATFQWNANRTGGVFTITIPAATDGSGAYTISGARDTSANVMASHPGTLRKMVQLVTNGGFEDGLLTGWTTSFTGTSAAPVVATVPATGTYSARVGNATAAAQTGYSTLYQNVVLPAGAVSISISVAYRSYTNYGLYYYYDENTCSVQDSTGATTLVTLFSTYLNTTLFSTATASLTAYAGQTVRITCETYQYGFAVTGMYLDDVSVVATL